MENTNLEIRAKKISELDSFESANIQDTEHTYIIVGYNDGGQNKQNYKMSLSTIRNYASSGEIDDEILLSKIQNFISSNQIILPVSQGPVGPQGPQGPIGDTSFINLDEIQAQIDEIQNIINRYHQSFNINYNLTNVNSLASNPSSITSNNIVTLYFNTPNGYIMPNTVTVQNAQYNYNRLNGTITIENPTADVNIIIEAERAQYSLETVFTNITATAQSTEYSKYVLGGSVSYTLQANSKYKLPTKIESINCDIQYTPNFDYTTANLTIRCNGTGNMYVNVTAISDLTYYWGIISIDESTSDKITIDFSYDVDETINGINSINIRNTDWLISSKQCPFTINSSFVLSNNVIGGKESVIIVPQQYYIIESSKFVDDNNMQGYLHSTTFPVPFTPNDYKLIDINGVPHYCLDMQNGLSAGLEMIIN